MKVINSCFEILTPLDGTDILKHIEKCGRVCYKSEHKIVNGSHIKFAENIIKRGHESVLEHFDISVKVICDRGVSHEIVRHRIASYSQESTRYCNYSSGDFNGEITVIKPCFFDYGSSSYNIWYASCENAEKAYFDLLNYGCSPQEARSVLPNSLKTEIVMTMNLREWRHFFKLRCSNAAHPQIREIAIPLCKTLQRIIPVIFDDISF